MGDAKSSELRINGNRLWASLMEMAKIGATPKGGVCRLTLTDLDKQGRDLFVRWCQEAGCTVKVDQMGNIFARRAGPQQQPRRRSSPAATSTRQPTGGNFDGVYGVLGGLEVIRTLNDHGIETERPIEVVDLDQRGRLALRAGDGRLGRLRRRVHARVRPTRATDQDGKTIGDELKRIGYPGDASRSASARSTPSSRPHIEQGPILEAEGKTIGVVTDAQGQRWYEMHADRAGGHAGPTPMPVRNDALLGAAQVVQLVNEIGLTHPPLGLSRRSACCTSIPNSRNVIPGRVVPDGRLPPSRRRRCCKMDAELQEGVAKIAAKAGSSTT